MTTEQLIYAGFMLLLIGLSANNARRLILPIIITIPGMLAGLVLSWWFPSIHSPSTGSASLIASGAGVIVGAGAMHQRRGKGRVCQRAPQYRQQPLLLVSPFRCSEQINRHVPSFCFLRLMRRT